MHGIAVGLKASQHQFEVCTIYHDIMAMMNALNAISPERVGQNSVPRRASESANPATTDQRALPVFADDLG